MDTWVSRPGDSITLGAIGLVWSFSVRWPVGCFDRGGEVLAVQHNRTAALSELPR